MANPQQGEKSPQNQQNPRNPQSAPDQQKQQERDHGQMGGQAPDPRETEGKRKRPPADQGNTGQGN